jgi:hypothetical protein
MGLGLKKNPVLFEEKSVWILFTVSRTLIFVKSSHSCWQKINTILIGIFVNDWLHIVGNGKLYIRYISEFAEVRVLEKGCCDLFYWFKELKSHYCVIFFFIKPKIL